MGTCRLLCCSLALVFLPALSRASAPRQDAQDTRSTPDVTVAVVDFSGTDAAIGRLLADVLRADLARNDSIHVMERAEVLQALDKMDVEPDVPLTTAQTRRLGRDLHADRLILGSFDIHDDQISIVARLLHASSGRTVTDGSWRMTGDRPAPRALAHRLARQLTRRLTESDPAAADEGSAPEAKPNAPEDTETGPSVLPQEEPRDSLETLRQEGLIPEHARPNGALLERDLAALVRRIAQRMHTSHAAGITAMDPIAPVTRIRTLTALVKLAVSRDEIASYRDKPRETTLPDAARVPSWGVPYAAAAIEQGWWPEDQPLRPRETATWSFVGDLLAKMPIVEEEPDKTPADESAPAPRHESYTGLIVDARDLSLERTMSPRILDEDGHVLYPDPKHVPGMDTLQDKGMASYDSSEENARRAGSHPLVVHAIDVSGSGHDDLIVSNETADQIRAANRRNHFLSRWAVSILIASN